MQIDSWYRCECGANTFELSENGQEYSFHPNTYSDEPALDSELRLTPDRYNCNHCVNKWGLDLCACGSGEPFKNCDFNSNVCGRPAQEVGGRTHVRGSNAFGMADPYAAMESELTECSKSSSDLAGCLESANTLFKQYQQMVANIGEEIIAELESTPMPEGTIVLSESPKCFVVRHNDVKRANNLSAEHFNSPSQTSILVERIRKATASADFIAHTHKISEDALDNGWVYSGTDRHRYKIALNEPVKAKISKLLGVLDKIAS